MNRILRTAVTGLALIAAAALILVFGFRISHMTVDGNERCNADQISEDLTSTSLLKNTLYFSWKYRSPVYSPDAPYLTSVRAKMLSPTSVRVTVTESKLIGRVTWENQNVYFDENGVVQVIGDQVLSNIPLVTGVEIEEPVLYQRLAVSNASTLRTMLSITQLLIQADFLPDSVSFDPSGNMSLRFGSVLVNLGQDEYLEEKIANLVQIYPQVSGRGGTLSMEGFTGKNSSVTFREEGTAEEDESEGEGDTGSGETLTGVGTDSTPPDQEEGSAEADASQDQEGADQEDNKQEDGSQAQNTTSGVMAFDSSGNLHYDAHIENGQVVDGSGNPIEGCSVDENGNIRDGYWNIIDPNTGANLNGT